MARMTWEQRCARRDNMRASQEKWGYEHWRHGGWYVCNVRYPHGAVGCVSNNYPDKKWRIACDPRPFDEQPTFRTRDEAAQAEYDMVEQMKRDAITELIT